MRQGSGPTAAEEGRSVTSGAETPKEFWEARYAEADRVWSGRVNPSLAEVVRRMPAGRALDLGCGEGGDAIWLAQRGWQTTGVDISATAIARARAAAKEAGVPDGRLELITADLSSWEGDGGCYDLVTASFFHSRVELPRTAILQRAAGLVAPGGALVIVSHADFPPWAEDHDPDAEGAAHGHRFLTADEEVSLLGLGAQWDPEITETRGRQAIGPDGRRADVEDVIVLLRRRPE